MVKIADFIYYALMKNAGILMLILGAVLFIMVFIFWKMFGAGITGVTSDSLKTCDSDEQCFSDCGECVSFPSNKICEPAYLNCNCIDSKCTAT